MEIETNGQEPVTSRQKAEALQALIKAESARGEIVPVETWLELDEITRLTGGHDIWRVIVKWPDHLQVVIIDAEQWSRRRQWFVEKKKGSE